MSKLIEVSKYEPGMILASPILNRYGQVLLAAGVELVPKHMTIFSTWGIKLITVKSKDSEEEIVFTDEMRLQAEKIFSTRINWQPKNSLEKDFYEMSVKKVLLNISRKNK